MIRCTSRAAYVALVGALGLGIGLGRLSTPPTKPAALPTRHDLGLVSITVYVQKPEQIKPIVKALLPPMSGVPTLDITSKRKW